MSRDVSVSIQREESFYGLHPDFGRPILLRFDHRISLRRPDVAAAARGNHVSGKDDLLRGEVHLQIPARVRRRKMKHIDSNAVDRERLARRQDLVWQAKIVSDSLAVKILFGRRSCGEGLREFAVASMSFLQFSWAIMVKPGGKAARPLTWSTSLCVRITVVTGLGVSLAISANTCLPEAGAIVASTTMTPSLPIMKPAFPPPPASAQ